MFKYSTKQLMLFISVVIMSNFFYQPANSQATQVPTKPEIQYAGILLKTTFDEVNSDLAMARKAQSNPPTTCRQYLPYIIAEMNNSKKSYMKLYNIQPPEKFKQIHNSVLRNGYEEINLSKTLLAMCQKDESIQTVQKATSARGKSLVNSALQTLSSFEKIILSWNDASLNQTGYNRQQIQQQMSMIKNMLSSSYK